MNGPAFDVKTWEARIRAHRAEKDEYMETAEESPIPPDERETFQGLSYFPLDPTYRFEATLELRDEPDLVSLQTNRDTTVEYERVGTIGVTIEGDHRTLAVFRAPNVNDLFVPFGDETNGDTTWKHGRYLTLDLPGPADSGDVVLDFNLAYNPFCVYTDEYVAVLPPSENELSVPIRAGERRYAGTSAASSNS